MYMNKIVSFLYNLCIKHLYVHTSAEKLKEVFHKNSTIVFLEYLYSCKLCFMKFVFSVKYYFLENISVIVDFMPMC